MVGEVVGLALSRDPEFSFESRMGPLIWVYVTKMQQHRGTDA